MATVRDVITRALRRIRELGVGDTASAEDAQLGLDALNDMIASWPTQGVQAYYTPLSLSDTFAFFVPPPDLDAETIARCQYIGTWDAATNNPYLSSGSGLRGEIYKVSVGGNRVLNAVASWAAGEHAIFNGSQWVKAIPSDRFNRAVIDLLAVELVPEFGKDPDAILMRNAATGWLGIEAAYIKAPLATFDAALMRTYTRTYLDTTEAGDLLPSAALLDEDGVPLGDD